MNKKQTPFTAEAVAKAMPQVIELIRSNGGEIETAINSAGKLSYRLIKPVDKKYWNRKEGSK